MRTISRPRLEPVRSPPTDPSGPLVRMRFVADDGGGRDRRKLFLLDGHSLAYRAFSPPPPPLATTSGTVTNAVYGFTSMLIKLLAEEKPDLIAVAFDTGKPTVRLEMDAEYKAGRRETPADFGPQLALIEEVLDTLRIPIVRVEGQEADDARGTRAEGASAEGVEGARVARPRRPPPRGGPGPRRRATKASTLSS